MSLNLKMRIILTVVCLAVIAFCGYQLWQTQNNYSAEEKLHESLLTFRPPAADNVQPVGNTGKSTSPPDAASPPPAAKAPVHNEGITRLRGVNPDAVGWITLDGTAIDYPFVQAADNDFYLRQDIHKKYAYAGTVFMDYRCSKDFSDFNTVLYGHNMKNGSMFHDLTKFRDRDYFDTHTSGVISLEDASLSLEIFAYLNISDMDIMVFKRDVEVRAQLDGYLSYVRAHAAHWREVPVTEGDRLVTLSTCSYEFDNARAVVVAKILD